MNHRFVTSLGDPYFAFVAESVGDASTLPTHGLNDVAIVFRVERLPSQVASADELHPLFSFHTDIQTQPALYEIGITPSGRVKAVLRSGFTAQTAVGVINANDSLWHEAVFDYDYLNAGSFSCIVDNIDFSPGFDPSPTVILPAAGYNSRMMLFNGRTGLTNMRASIRLASTVWSGALPFALTYNFGEGSGDTLTPTVTGVSEMPTACVLTARYYDPIFTPSYGAVPTFQPNGSYRWGLTTDYTRLPKPATTYTRVPA